MPSSQTTLSFKTAARSTSVWTIAFDGACCMLELTQVAHNRWQGWLGDHALLAEHARMSQQFRCTLDDNEGHELEGFASINIDSRPAHSPIFGAQGLRAIELVMHTLDESQSPSSKPQVLRT